MSSSMLANRSAKNNPFAVHRTEQCRFRFPCGNWDSNLQSLANLSHRAAVVGQHGCGKTTLLLELHDQLSSRRIETEYIFISRDLRIRSEQLGRLLNQPGSQRILIVDGIERFPWWQREKLFRTSRTFRGLVVAVHGSCRLPTWIRCRSTLELLDDLLSELQIDDRSTLEIAHDLFARRRGNIREVFRDLYDVLASR